MTGRLIKGELAKSTIERQEQKKTDVINKVDWINRLLSNSESIPQDFKRINITGLAAYENSELGLRKVAYNTFKSHIRALEMETNLNLDSLSESLEHLSRFSFGPKLQKKISKQETILGLKERLREKDEMIQNLTDDLVDIRYCYNNLLSVLKNRFDRDKSIQNTVRRHNETVGLYMEGKNRVVDNTDES